MNALWDFSFKKFLTPTIVGFLYGVSMFFIGLLCLVSIGYGFQGGLMGGLVFLVVSPIFGLFSLILVRTGLESLVASIKIAENTVEISENIRLVRQNTNRIP